MPHEAVADGVGLGASSAVTDSEVEGDEAVAAILVVLGEGGSLCADAVGGAVPGVLVADILCLDACVAVPLRSRACPRWH